jgi:hypothetical protein
MGWDNFDHIILLECFNQDRDRASNDAYDIEQELISESLSNPLCLNGYCTKGGRFKHTQPHSESAKTKMSKARKGMRMSEDTKDKLRKPLSDDRRSKIAEYNRRPEVRESKRQANLGRGWSDEARCKFLDTNSKAEVKLKRSLAQLGKKQSDETKAKRSESLRGKTRSEDIKEKISTGRSANNKTFKITSPSGEVFMGKNLTQFCKSIGVWPACLSEVCRGLKKSYKGWTGEYISDEATEN